MGWKSTPSPSAWLAVSWTEVGARVTSEQDQGQSSARLRDYQIDNLIPTTHGENRASKLAFDGGSLSRSD